MTAPIMSILPKPIEENHVDLRFYWTLFNKYKSQILGLTLLIGLLTTLIVFSLPPIYRATTTLLIETDKPNIISIDEIYEMNALRRDYYQTQLEILKSRVFIEKVVDKLNLVSHDALTSMTQPKSLLSWLPSSWRSSPKTLKPEEQRQTVIEHLMTHLMVTPVRNTQLIKIHFESSDAELAAKIPNTLADIYIESDLEARLEMTKKAATWLTERLEGLRQKLRDSEQALQTYLETHHLVNVTGVKSVATRKIEEMASNLVKAHQQLAEAESVYVQVQAIRGQPISAFESIPAVLRHPLVQNLKQTELEIENQVSELSKRYGPKHPKMISANAELKTARRNTVQQIKRVIDGVTKEYEMALANVQAIERTMKQQEQQIQGINRKEFQFAALEREVEVNRQLYDLFLTRFKETDVSQDLQVLQSTLGRIVEPALMPSVPAKPKKALIISVTLVLGLMLTIGLAFLLEYLDNTIKNAEDVEQKLGLSLLGILPKLKTSAKTQMKPQLMLLQAAKSPFAEFVRTIRTGMMLSRLDSPRKIFVVTSSEMGEGKTTFAINQAIALGSMEKTLLVDADLRRPAIGAAFGLNIQTPGLSELVAGTRKFSECLHHHEEAQIDIIPSGVIPPNPLELLSSQRFKDLLVKLEQHYQYIVIDSAPTLAVSDALVLAKQADSTVVHVVKADVTSEQTVQESLKRLHQVEVPVLGIVLNQVNIQKLSKYYGHQYRYYGRYGDYSYSDSLS